MTNLYYCPGCKEEKYCMPDMLCDECYEIKMSYGTDGDESFVDYIDGDE